MTSPTRRSSSSATPRPWRRRSRSSCTTRRARATRPTTCRVSGRDRYKGQFDMGYEAMRVETLARQKGLGVVPADTELPPINPIGTAATRTGPDGKPFPVMDETRPWDTLSDKERRLFARMAEVYAGFLTHADHHIGRLLGFLEQIEERENTVVILVSDNGASGEGGPNGSVNEMKFINGLTDEVDAALAMVDELGSTKTYNHYPNGWAMAFNTPFKMWKRYEFNGGTSDPCIISWPAGTKARGEIRHQYHHAIDLVPTVLDVLGVEAPAAIKGHVQSHFDGVSMRYSLDDGAAPTTRHTQFFSMLGSRGIWHDGWKAITTHPTVSGWSNFNDDEWELYHVEVDRSELHNLAAQEPAKLRELVALWHAEAGANGAFPLDDRAPLEIILTPRPVLSAPRNRYVYFPDCAEVPESQAVNVRNRSYSIGALVDIPAPGAHGVLFAHGSRFGGHALYIKDNRLHYVYNWVGMFKQQIVGDRRRRRRAPTSSSRPRSTRTGEDPPGVSVGIPLALARRHQGRRGARSRPNRASSCSRARACASDATAASGVTDEYPGERPWHFTGGTIHRVAVDVSGEVYINLEHEAHAMLMPRITRATTGRMTGSPDWVPSRRNLLYGYKGGGFAAACHRPPALRPDRPAERVGGEARMGAPRMATSGRLAIAAAMAASHTVRDDPVLSLSALGAGGRRVSPVWDITGWPRGYVR